ncbi:MULTISPECIES: hypothetical protein [Chromobacterium]|uniref:Uncharacterized protein n=1 Tax=Chromobacterium rhizoryzae TaxID=1778675 RepID=A0AAD0RMB3_9NEIS|nr:MULTISPECIES: hypothetical protein [Chromobacterium]AXT45172.1 hypothetical protein D1345_02725 [Chromobacterium rhizoryzae]
MANIDEVWVDLISTLILKARSSAGITDIEINQAISSTNQLITKYKGKKSLPMAIVNILIDMQASLITSADWHKNEKKQTAMSETIYKTALILSDLARDITV